MDKQVADQAKSVESDSDAKGIQGSGVSALQGRRRGRKGKAVVMKFSRVSENLNLSLNLVRIIVLQVANYKDSSGRPEVPK